jgi:2-polyprenyl-6-methoxyphenol hydroxylase-like FAD-dependent oxidoreductase
MADHLGQHAIVIGGSMAGLTTARVLADYFDQVTVLERDQIEDQPAIHRSIPQGDHVHALLLGGLQVLSSLFDGLTDKLQRLGAVRFRVAQEFAFFLPDGKAYTVTGSVREPRDLGIDCYSQSRGLLEYCVRECTLACKNVTYLSGCSAQGLISQHKEVRGVRYAHDGQTYVLAADLVVDAAGRGSQAHRWLVQLGFPGVEETTIGVDFAYSSTKFRIPDHYSGAERVLGFIGLPPDSPMGAVLEQIENGMWHVSLGGRFGHYPPTDEEGFIAFAKALPNSTLYDLLKDAERIADIVHYRFPTSRLRHYERLTAFPERFLVLGDAISSFNPIYGQGMSSAALQAKALQQLLAERVPETQGLDRLGLAFFPKAAEVVAAPWALAASFDFAYPQTSGTRPPDLEESSRYLTALDTLVAEDVEVQQLVTEVFQLAKPLSCLREEPLQSRVVERLQQLAKT